MLRWQSSLLFATGRRRPQAGGICRQCRAKRCYSDEKTILDADPEGGESGEAPSAPLDRMAAASGQDGRGGRREGATAFAKGDSNEIGQEKLRLRAANARKMERWSFTKRIDGAFLERGERRRAGGALGSGHTHRTATETGGPLIGEEARSHAGPNDAKIRKEAWPAGKLRTAAIVHTDYALAGRPDKIAGLGATTPGQETSDGSDTVRGNAPEVPSRHPMQDGGATGASVDELRYGTERRRLPTPVKGSSVLRKVDREAPEAVRDRFKLEHYRVMKRTKHLQRKTSPSFSSLNPTRECRLGPRITYFYHKVIVHKDIGTVNPLRLDEAGAFHGRVVGGLEKRMKDFMNPDASTSSSGPPRIASSLHEDIIPKDIGTGNSLRLDETEALQGRAVGGLEKRTKDFMNPEASTSSSGPLISKEVTNRFEPGVMHTTTKTIAGQKQLSFRRRMKQREKDPATPHYYEPVLDFRYTPSRPTHIHLRIRRHRRRVKTHYWKGGVLTTLFTALGRANKVVPRLAVPQKNRPENVEGSQSSSLNVQSKATPVFGIIHKRPLSTSSFRRYPETASIHSSETTPAIASDPVVTPIRRRLQIWQDQRLADVAHHRELQHQDALKQISRTPYPSLPSQFGEKKLTEPFQEVQNEISQSSIGDPEDPGHDDVPFADFRQGDVVEFQTPRGCVLAVFVRRFERQCQLYTMEGEWVHMIVEGTCFALPRFFEPSEVEAIKKFLPDCEIPDSNVAQLRVFSIEVPREPGAPLVNKMQAFVREANEEYRAHAQRIDKVYEQVADDKGCKYMTLQEIASVALGIPVSAEIAKPSLWAVHRRLIEAVEFSPSRRTHWKDGTFEILSRTESTIFRDVQAWVREHQEFVSTSTKWAIHLGGSSRPSLASASPKGKHSNLAAFAANARATITESRKYRPLNSDGGVGPCKVQPSSKTGELFCGSSVAMGERSFTDATILRFIELWAARNAIHHSDPLASLGPLILRTVGMYEDRELDQETGFTFLQEMGVVTPWDSRIQYISRLALPGCAGSHSNLAMGKLQAKINSSISPTAPQGTVQKRFPIDSMQHLRKDWSDLEVFCIDAKDAMEIDDGISLEAIPGDDTQYWIHIHVANPTAFIPPDDPISEYAAGMTESIYLPERTFSMLPQNLGREYFSLGAGRPALTFSAKVNKFGDIVDYAISPGIIRNVTYMTPDLIRSHLDPNSATPPSFAYAVGNSPASSPSLDDDSKHSTTMTDGQKLTLKTLMELGRANQQRREDRGSWTMQQSTPKISVLGLFYSVATRTKIRRFGQDPAIVVRSQAFKATSNREDLSLNHTDDLVRNVMMIACQVAGLWCGERHIPVPFRSTESNPEMRDRLQQFQEQILMPTMTATGTIPFHVSRRYNQLSGKGQISTVPARHFSLGVDHYVKVTSPLRRYGDMLAHWQIEAALREEAEAGKSLIGAQGASQQPFSKGNVERMISMIKNREDSIKGASRLGELHWYTQLLHRAFHYKEDLSLPREFHVFITGRGPTGEHLDGMVRELNLRVLLKDKAMANQPENPQLGDWWLAKIESISLYRREVLMEPLRLMERTIET